MQGKALQDFTIDKTDDLKGQNIVALDVQGKSSITDRMIICMGTFNHHVMSITDCVVQESRVVGPLPLGVEGENSADWIVVGLGDVIVRVMQGESRRLYELEKLWSRRVKLQLVAVRTKMPDWVQTGFTKYLRCLPKGMPFELIKIPARKRGENADIERMLDKESEQMLAAADKNRIATFNIPDKPWDTPQLAAELERWELDGRDVSLLISGPEGLSPTRKAVAKQSWSLSTLTLPHPLVRVLVAESLCRAWSITTNCPYHREW